MKQLILNIPDDLPLEDNEALLALASKLYELGKLSLGQANVSGLSKEEFMKALAKYEVSVINHSPADLVRDIDNAKSYNI